MLVIRILPLTNLLLPVAIAHHAVELSATARDVCSKGCSLGVNYSHSIVAQGFGERS